MSPATLTPAGRGLGHRPDQPDHRDRLFDVPTAVPHQFVDLTKTGFLPPIWDQGQLGSCVPHGVLAAFLYAAAKAGVDDPMLSRLALYYLTRSMEGTVSEDSGCMPRDAIKVCATQGVPPETDWPYDITTYRTPPGDDWRGDARSNVAVSYESVEVSRAGIQACLSAGYPVVIANTLYESFEGEEAQTTGVIPKPGKGEQVIGGHCQLIVGIGTGAEWKTDGQFPDALDHVNYAKVRNSWGTEWAADGHELIGIPNVTRTGSDFWTIRNVT